MEELKLKLKHCAHDCVLTSPEIVADGICNICYKDEPVEFACNNCNFDLCKTCSMIPPTVSHGFHPQHPLEFCIRKNEGTTRSMLCSGCGTLFSGSFYFKCKECEIYLHVGCGLLENITTGWDAEEIFHYSHVHSVRRCKPGLDSNASCLLCELPISPSAISYDCAQCSLFVHQHCLDLPREIQHPVHPAHPLIRLDFTYLCGDGIDCNACKLHIDGVPFGCPECNVYLHMRCADTLLRGLVYKSPQHRLFYRLTGADYDLTFLPCEICKGIDKISVDSYFHCMECDLRFHYECLGLPESIFRKSYHIHRLFCKTFQTRDDEDSMEYCGVCETLVHTGHPAYSCKTCDFVSHIECILHEEVPSPLYLKDLYSCGKEDVVTKPVDQEDISEAKKLESKLMVNGINHTHVLTLAGPRKARVCCYICHEEIFGRTWKCNVVIGRPWTNSACNPAKKVMNCGTCKAEIKSYNLFCRICNFIICTTCMVKAKHFLGESHRGKKLIGAWEGRCLLDRHFLVQVMVSRSYPMGCNFCDGRLSGITLSCMECDDIYHLRCTKLGRQKRFTSLLHSDHTLRLELMPRSNSNSTSTSISKCTSCKLSITKYGLCCYPCKLSFHIKCSELVEVSEDTGSSHRHTFYNYWIDDWKLARTCNVCSRVCGMSFYGCIDCNFNAHVECLGFPANVKNQLHKHTLELSFTSRSKKENCSHCGLPCDKRVYYCHHCEVVFHMECLMSTDESKAATKEEQLQDIYLMYIERHLLNLLGKDGSHNHRFGYKQGKPLLMEETDSTDEEDRSTSSGDESSRDLSPVHHYGLKLPRIRLGLDAKGLLKRPPILHHSGGLVISLLTLSLASPTLSQQIGSSVIVHTHK
ncbi:unnamed protein product [Microthlaspi erraticum]|uniref:Phorbol-ester/DAG-type domain-containing protein n=1 Tax=Microthlaspi erraticum TaxID=1685480 RepID=A0A6D2JZU6_9BRAS|nr:unnamed protein product [Microthlaspi erraticum]